MNKFIEILINQEKFSVVEGTSVVAALNKANGLHTRLSVTGEKRHAFCGMGVCQECRVTVNGIRKLACQTVCQNGMTVETLL